MRGLVYHGPGRISWDTVPDPSVQEATDVLVRVEAAAVCGSDLHIRRGELPEVRPGTVLGHEAVGEVIEAGPEVHDRRPGDQVIVSSVSGCGRCAPCRDSRYGQCRGGGGWVLGNVINGTQAEYVRVPFADYATHRRPAHLSLDDAVLLAEVLPTAYEVGVRKGRVGPKDTVVIVGAGPVGLAAVSVARLYAPRRIVAVDLSDARLRAALRLGADAAQLPGRLLADLSDGPGADVVIEAAGDPDSFLLATRAVRTGGRLANIGHHGKPATLHLECLWRRNVTISTGQVDTSSTPWLIDLLSLGRLTVSPLVTHRFGLDRAEDAYDTFSSGPDTGALKVVLHRRTREAERQETGRELASA
ncbi:zinc-dependent alcohol dehydrogenase family protein [Streptomyces thermospinosisporus]|uniref:Zinc-dependent alcohol dehydrogenase family protein n=1 Tax=Streptomyces thermospinosisporus TaxID=161482 RepID=A0ABN1YTT4_9ACTN